MSIVVYNTRTHELVQSINNCLKSDPDFGFKLPKLNYNSFLVAWIENNQLVSFIHCLKSGTELTFSTGFTNLNFRRRRLSTILRQWIISNNQDIKRFISLPLPGSYSTQLLEKLGFVKEGNIMVLSK